MIATRGATVITNSPTKWPDAATVLDPRFLTNAERSVLAVALADYRDKQAKRKRILSTAKARANANAGESVAGDLIRQLAGQ